MGNNTPYQLDKLFEDGSVIVRGEAPSELQDAQPSESSGVKVVWMSEKQIAFCEATHSTKVMVAGRGFGKSAMLALQFILWMLEMPRAKGYLCAMNLTQAKNETFAVIKDLWRVMGFKEGRDYVVGVDPRKHWVNFKESWIAPEDYCNCVVFKNGFTIVFVSSYQIQAKRGGGYDCGVIDEAGFVDEKVFSQVLSKATRANAFRYKSRYHHQKVIVSSRPRDVKGQWVNEMEDKHKADPDRILYCEASARDNPFLTADWFENELATSGYLDFLIEVENEKLDRLPDGFYHQFSDSRHVYYAAPQYIGGVRYDGRYVATGLLDLSFDFGGWFSCCSAFQCSAGEKVENLVKQFYVDKDERINELVDKVCEYFVHQEFKFVRLWGEPRGRNKDPRDVKDIYEQMAERFVSHGWSAKICVPSGYRTGFQRDRYANMNNILAEDNALLPKLRISGEWAKDIITAIKICDRDSNFDKVKTLEKDKKRPQVHAPHFTDTVDYLFEQKYGVRRGRSRRAKRAT